MALKPEILIAFKMELDTILDAHKMPPSQKKPRLSGLHYYLNNFVYICVFVHFVLNI